MTTPPVALVVCIATNRYLDFVPPLHASIRQHWRPPGVDIRFLVLTNRTQDLPPAPDVIVRQVEHRPWPAMTLDRYRLMLNQRDALDSARWIIYLDADLRMVGDPGQSFLCPSFAVIHPGYYRIPKGPDLPFERRAASTACVADLQAGPYLCGGLQGGGRDEFLAMCEALAQATEEDARQGLMARWHDESHHNRYRQDHPPTVMLPPSFAYPEDQTQAHAWGLTGLQPVILALNKDHISYRYGFLGAAFRKAWKACLPLRRRIARWRGRA